MTREEKRRYIESKFPQLQLVTRRDWAEAACDIWVKVWEQSPWENLDEVPANPLTPSVSLMQHMQFVIDTCVQVAKARQSLRGEPLNMDVLIVAAVLHDVSKLLEYERRGGKEVLSRLGELYLHGFYGAHMALEAGLPEEIVHLISTHPPSIPFQFKMAEGLIIHYCDLIDADLNRFRIGAPLWASQK